MQEFEIVFYDKPDGTEPVKEFLSSVDEKNASENFKNNRLAC